MKDDTISRAAAIDAMMKLQAEDIEAYGASIPEGFDGDRAVTAIKALPSAQPTGTNTVQVEDCISRAAAIEAMRKAKDKSEAHRMLAQLPSAQPGWIPTSERLPDNDRAVLVTLKWAEDDYEVAVGEYWHNSTASHGWGSFEGHVIAWQPLPTPYREGGQDNGTD